MGTFSPSGKQMFVLLVPDQEMTVENQPNISKDEIKKEIVEKKAFGEYCDCCDH